MKQENKKTRMRKARKEFAESHDRIFKQFWKQKLNELLGVIFIITILSLVPAMAGSLLLGTTASFCHDDWGVHKDGETLFNSLPAVECSFSNYWFAGVLIGVALFAVGGIIYIFVKSNWNAAKFKVKEDIAEKYKLMWYDL